jgi:hypothetical protein
MMPLITSGNTPVFCKRTVCVVPAAPTIVLPKLMVVRLRLVIGRGWGTPVPVSATAFADAAFCAFELMLSAAFLIPRVLGRNVTLTSQLVPGATLAHAPVIAYEPASTPVSEMLLTVIVAVPVLAMATVRGALEVLIIWSPKSMIDGSEISGAGAGVADPVTATLNVFGTIAGEVMLTCPLKKPTDVGAKRTAIKQDVAGASVTPHSNGPLAVGGTATR